MSERTSSKPSIADYVVARRKRKECFLDEIDRLIDWNPLEKLLRKTLKRVVNAVGNPAYPPLPMFKILLLQRWYNLRVLPGFLITTGAAEGLNSKIMAIKRRACGYRNREHFKTAIYFFCGGLDLYPKNA